MLIHREEIQNSDCEEDAYLPKHELIESIRQPLTLEDLSCHLLKEYDREFERTRARERDQNVLKIVFERFMGRHIEMVT